MRSNEQAAEIVRAMLLRLHAIAPDSIGDRLHFQVVSCDAAAGEYVLRCETQEWMRNVAGTLHGGISATILDQAFGTIVYAVKETEGIASTVEMQTSFQRPLIPGEDVLVHVRVLSAGKTMIHLTAEAASVSRPEKLCVSGTALYCCIPGKISE